MGRRGIENRGTSIRIGFSYKGEYCKESLKMKPTPRNLRYAERYRMQILSEIERGTFDYAAHFPDSPRAAYSGPGHVIKMRKYLNQWLGRVKPTIAASTYRDYKNTVIYQLVPAFGDYTVSQMTRSVVRDWASGLDTTNKRIANLVSPLRQALSDAVDDDLIDSNPLSDWRYRRREAPSPQDDVDPFTESEQDAILAQLDGQGRNLIRFAFWTGLRTSELVALDWSDIDWTREVAVITKAVTQASQGSERTKTEGSQREVKLLPPALEALTDQKAHTFVGGERVFRNPRTGKPWTGDQAIRKTLWTHALKRAGVRYRYPYQTRHTYASMMLSAGEHPMWVAKQMGHKDWSMISRRYGKWMPDLDVEAGLKAVERFTKTDHSLPKRSKNEE